MKKGLVGAAGLVAAVALDRTSAPNWLLFGTVAVFLIVAVFLDWFFSSKTRRLYFGAVALAYVGVTGVTLLRAPDGVSITINCAPVPIPMSAASGDLLFAVYLDPKWSNKVLSAPASRWPTWATEKDAAYRCEVVNNATLPLHGLLLRFVVTFREERGLPATREIAVTSPVSLESQRSLTLHLADDTRLAIEVVPPASVTARVGDDRESRSIPVRYSTIDGRPVRLRGFNP